MESVILSSPMLLCGYAVALALCAFAIIRKTGFVITAISVIIFVATTTCALLFGATLTEVSVCALCFFIFNIIPIWKNRGDK